MVSMMSHDKTIVLEKLTGLSPEDLQDVKTRVEFLSSTGSQKNSEGVSLFYDVTTKHLEMYTGVSTPPYFVFKKTKHFKKLREACRAVDKNLLSIVSNPQKREKVQFYILFVKIMLNYIEIYDLPRDITVMFNAYQKFPSQLDQAFPSYGASGLLSILFKRNRYENK